MWLFRLLHTFLVAMHWFEGWTFYDKVKAMFVAKLKAKRQENQNADLEADFSIETNDIQASGPANTKVHFQNL